MTTEGKLFTLAASFDSLDEFSEGSEYRQVGLA